jgi:hypothetical protein
MNINRLGGPELLHQARYESVRRSRFGINVHRQATWAVAATIIALAVGASLSVTPVLALTLVGAAFLAGVVAWFDLLGLAVILTAALPWLVVTSEVLPRLTLTFAAGATAAVILLVAVPRSDGSHSSLLLRIGAVLFFSPIIISVAREGLHSDAIQAAKYVVFPMMVLVVAEGTNSDDLTRLRTVAVWSSVMAISVNLFLGLTGIANVTYYGSGEILGYADSHTLALLAGCLTAALLATDNPLAWSPAIAVGAIATVATGVRSTLPGLIVATFLRMLAAGVRLRMMIIIGLAIAAVFLSGAANVVESRFHRGEQLGEFQSFAHFGSGRGSIYDSAIHTWWHSSPIEWVIGTGLRSILKIEQQQLGGAFGGHSDIIDVGVQIGIAGLIGLLIMWWILFARAKSKLPLLVLACFALVNGILEVGGPLVIGMLLTTGATLGGVRHKDAKPRATRSRLSLDTGGQIQGSP